MRIGLVFLVLLLQPLADARLSRGAIDQGPPEPSKSTLRGCVFCQACPPGWHRTDQMAPDPDYSEDDGLHYCRLGWCLEHGVCGGEEEDAVENSLATELDAVRQAVASGDPAMMGDVLREASPSVRLSTERSAIQVSGCGGEIVAHFPLPPGTVEALMHPSH